MLVIDASAALYLLASEDGLGPLADLALTAPALMWSEVTSVLNEMRWRGELSLSLADATFERLLASPIDRHADDELYAEAREIARRLGWPKTYDAEYVALARKLDVRLVTRDERIRRGAGRLVTVVGPDEVLSPVHSTGSEEGGRVLAARRSTSMSKLVAAEIEKLVGEGESYQRAKAVARAHMSKGFHLGGGPPPHRDAIHDR